jgi:tetratricopeptide (TPR) repeat protein
MSSLLPISLVMLALANTAIARTPYLPGDPDRVVMSIPADEQPVLQALRRLDAERRARPADLNATLRYARRAIEAGRQFADPRFMGFAEMALRPFARGAVNVEVRVLHATLAQHRHQYDRALAELAVVLETDPGHAQARLTRAVIHRVQGRPREALVDCIALRGRADTLTTTSCTASALMAQGKNDEAARMLDSVLAQPITADAPSRLWALTVRAELAEARGDADTDARYQTAIAAADGRDPYLLFAYADFLMERGAWADIRTLLLPHEVLDGALVRLAIAEKHLLAGTENPRLRKSFDDRMALIAARYTELALRGETPHARDAIRYHLELLDDPDAALVLARDNWTEQREPLDAMLLLDAADAANRPEARTPVTDWITATGIADARLQRRLDHAT